MRGAKVRLKKGGSDRDFVAGQRLERERIERADEHRGAGRGEQEIVEHERALAADRGEQSALREKRSAPGEQGERPADKDAHDGEDEDAARRDRRRRRARS